MNWRKSDSDYEFVETEVMLYPLYKKRVKEEEMNLILATPEHEEGGAHSLIPGRPTERIAFKLLTDIRILYLKKLIDSVDEVLEKLDEEKEAFIRYMYWDGGQSKTLEGIGAKFGISTHTCRRWNKAFLLGVGLKIGIMRESESKEKVR